MINGASFLKFISPIFVVVGSNPGMHIQDLECFRVRGRSWS